MYRPFLLALTTLIFPCTGFSQSPRTSPTKEGAAKLAQAYLKTNFPEYDTSAKPPGFKHYDKTAMDFTDSEKHGGTVWKVTFHCPPPKDPKTGEPTSPMLYMNLTVSICADGFAGGAMLTSR